MHLKNRDWRTGSLLAELASSRCVFDPKLQIQDVSLGTVAAFGTIFSLNASKVHQTPKFYPFSNIPSHVMCSHLDHP